MIFLGDCVLGVVMAARKQETNNKFTDPNFTGKLNQTESSACHWHSLIRLCQ